jgi:magnesium transporter
MDVHLITDAGVEERPVDELAALLDRNDGLVWVDIPNCDAEAVRVLSEVFGFHPMAIQDSVERNRVPKWSEPEVLRGLTVRCSCAVTVRG